MLVREHGLKEQKATTLLKSKLPEAKRLQWNVTQTLAMWSTLHHTECSGILKGEQQGVHDAHSAPLHPICPCPAAALVRWVLLRVSYVPEVLLACIKNWALIVAAPALWNQLPVEIR